MFMGLAISAIIGGYLAKFDLSIPIKFGSLPLIIPFLVVLTFKEPSIIRSELNHLQHVKASLKHILFQPNLRFMLFYIVILAVAFESIFKFSQPYMHQLGIPIPLISISFSCSYLLSASGAFIGQNLNNFFGERKLFLLLYILIFVSLLLLKVNTILAITGMIILFPLVEGIHGPITSGFINRYTRSKMRATVNSITNLSKSIATALVFPLFGIIAEHNISFIFLINAGAIFISIFVIRIWYQKLYDKQLIQ